MTVKVPESGPVSEAAASVAVTVTVGGEPVPVSGILNGELVAVLVITKFAERAPTARGIKFTVAVQLWPNVNTMLFTQVPETVRIKSPALVPVTVTAFVAAKVTASSSVFVNVTVCGVSASPNCMEPKVNLEGRGATRPVDAAATAATAADALTMPAPQATVVQSDPVPVGKARALPWRKVKTWLEVNVGFIDNMSEMTPVTCGAAMLVPS